MISKDKSYWMNLSLEAVAQSLPVDLLERQCCDTFIDFFSAIICRCEHEVFTADYICSLIGKPDRAKHSTIGGVLEYEYRYHYAPGKEATAQFPLVFRDDG